MLTACLGFWGGGLAPLRDSQITGALFCLSLCTDLSPPLPSIYINTDLAPYLPLFLNTVVAPSPHQASCQLLHIHQVPMNAMSFLDRHNRHQTYYHYFTNHVERKINIKERGSHRSLTQFPCFLYDALVSCGVIDPSSARAFRASAFASRGAAMDNRLPRMPRRAQPPHLL